MALGPGGHSDVEGRRSGWGQGCQGQVEEGRLLGDLRNPKWLLQGEAE